MNPRLFCRERGYQKALLLTYSFDPIFFEQVVLPDLWAGRSSDILVLGDTSQIESSIQSAAGQLWHLGKQYLLAGAGVPGAFHPKVFLRFGLKDGIVMLGSGNVTSSGWGGNQELGVAWMVGPNHIDKGGWLHPFLDDVLNWCQGDLERDALRRFKDVPWLSLTPATHNETNPVLYSRGEISLASELARRWAGRQFDSVKILTGSTDESGAFLRWAQGTFGITSATVGLTPSSASFVAGRLAELPLEVRLVATPADRPLPPANRPLHAKFYWFEGDDGPAAVMGSANCSAAAWLLSPKGAGNVESVVVFDRPDAKDFESVMKLFETPGKEPAEILVTRVAHNSNSVDAAPSFSLKSVQWDNLSRRIYAELVPAPDVAAQVGLQLSERLLPMTRMQGNRALWICEIAEGLDAGTMFASLIVSTESDTFRTLPRWIDDIASLEHASHAARLLEPFKALDQGTTSTERRQILDELQEVAQTLFNDSTSFRDPGFGGIDRKKKIDTPTEPVNPDNLIVHLHQTEQRAPNVVSGQPGALSLTGILRLLFDAGENEGQTTAAAGDEDIDEGQMLEAPPPSKQNATNDRSEANADREKIEARFRDRLATQIDTFLRELSSAEFGGRCTATQMVQAASFPLAVALRGRRKGWVTDELAEKWALELFAVLFRGKWASQGLLGSVEQRYVQNGQKDIFDEVVGDGTLWLVLVATLGGTNWSGVGTDIDKAVALREVFAAPQLLASATSARITDLLGKIRIDDARVYVANVAPSVNRLLNEIESALMKVWVSEMRNQGARVITHKSGDLLWRDNVGWAVCLEERQDRSGQSIKVRLRGVEKTVMAGFYVNVSEVCERHPELGRLVEELRSCVASTDIIHKDPAPKDTGWSGQLTLR